MDKENSFQKPRGCGIPSGKRIIVAARESSIAAAMMTVSSAEGGDATAGMKSRRRRPSSPDHVLLRWRENRQEMNEHGGRDSTEVS